MIERDLEAGLNKALAVMRPENRWQAVLVASELADSMGLEISLYLSDKENGPRFSVRQKVRPS